MLIRFKEGVHEYPPSVAMGFIRGGLAVEVKDEPEVKPVPPKNFTSVVQAPEAEPKEPEKKEDAEPPEHEAPPEAGEKKDDKQPAAAHDKRKARSTVRPARK